MSTITEKSETHEAAEVDTKEHLLAGSDGAVKGTTERGHTNDTDGVPYDRGWAWMVLLGSFVNYVLISAYVKTGGVLFVELLGHFGAPASKTALLFAIRGGVLSISGMFVMNAVIGRLGCRKTALIGAVLMSLSEILSSFATELVLLICLQAVLLGVADAMISASGEVLSAAYFRKRRALALGIIKSGASIGSVCYPPLLTYLIWQYGLRGALLLAGGIALHAFPAVFLLRPVSYFRKQHSTKQTTSDKEESIPAVTLMKQNCSITSLERVSPSESETVNDIHNMDDDNRIISGQKYSLVKAENEEASAEEGGINGLMLEAASDQNSHPEEEKHQDLRIQFDSDTHTITLNKNFFTQPNGNQPQVGKQRMSWLKSKLNVLDFSLCRRPSFSLFIVYFMLSPNINVGIDYLPALAQQYGLSKAEAAQLLSIAGGLDLVSRLSTGFLADLKIVPVPVMAGSALIGLGVIYQCTRFLTSFSLLVTLAVVQGLLAGMVNCLVSVLVLHIVGLQDMAKGIGFQLLAEGAFMSAFHPFLGYIRDTTGSYALVYHLTGCCLLGAAMALLFEELLRAREERQNQTGQLSENSS